MPEPLLPFHTLASKLTFTNPDSGGFQEMKNIRRLVTDAARECQGVNRRASSVETVVLGG